MQVLEETGLYISQIHFIHVSNCIHPNDAKHYVTIIMSASVAEVTLPVSIADVNPSDALGMESRCCF